MASRASTRDCRVIRWALGSGFIWLVRFLKEIVGFIGFRGFRACRVQSLGVIGCGFRVEGRKGALK